MPMLSFLGANHRLTSFHMDEFLFGLMKKKKSINEFTIGYMISTYLNINKAFRGKVEYVY